MMDGIEHFPAEETVLDKRMRWLRSELDPSRLTLEIAPYFNPMVPKVEGKVWYTDYVNNKTIQKKAAANPTFKNGFAPTIDFVWKPGKQLNSCSPRLDFDCVVASHVLEHVPNPLGWINELLSVTKVGGSILLILPDRQLTTDHYRKETTFAEVLAFAVEGLTKPSTGQILDFMTNSVEDYGNDGVLPYVSGIPLEEAKRAWNDEMALRSALRTKAFDNYIDVHCTAWTSTHFAQVFRRITKEKYIRAAVFDPVDNYSEFMIKLVKTEGSPVRLRPRNSFRLFWAIHYLSRYRRDIIAKVRGA
jgi:ubiquinone/menaquinone biosynthesis C-methylase UbiE